MRNAILELTDIQKQMDDEKAYKELFALLHNNYYVDYYVKLNDLLEPSKSEIYNYVDIPPQLIGQFKKAFEKIYDPNLYPNLTYILNLNNSQPRSTNQPSFLNQTDLVYYMPYPEDENGIPFTENDNPTYVPTVIEDEDQANYGYGYKEENGQWNTYITDDNYALQNATIQVTSAVSGISYNTNPAGDDNINITPNPTYSICPLLRGVNHTKNRTVILGHVKLTKQLDPWVGLFNSGGSELKFLRVDSESLINLNGQTVNLTTNQVQRAFMVYLKRKEINKMRRYLNHYKWVGSQWDLNWECSEPIHEQGFLVYEEDNARSLKFSLGEIKFELDSVPISANINVELELERKEPIVDWWRYDSNVFFSVNRPGNDLGQGTLYAEGSYNWGNSGWPVWGSGILSYTLPWKVH